MPNLAVFVAIWVTASVMEDLAPASSGTQEGPEILVQRGGPITLDGALGPGEWEAASRHPLGRGGEVLLQQRDGLIFVGVRGEKAGFPHLALAVGDSVWVLHASASLGTITYGKGKETWTLVKGPTWELQDPSLTPEALESRSTYLAENGWVGTTARMGKEGEAEFLVRLERFNGDAVRFGVAYLPLDSPKETIRWPDSNADDMGMTKLLTGPMPEELHLDPTGWALLRISREQ